MWYSERLDVFLSSMLVNEVQKQRFSRQIERFRGFPLACEFVSALCEFVR